MLHQDFYLLLCEQFYSLPLVCYYSVCTDSIICASFTSMQRCEFVQSGAIGMKCAIFASVASFTQVENVHKRNI